MRIKYVALADATLPLVVDRNRAYAGSGPHPEEAASYHIYDRAGREVREGSAHGYRQHADAQCAELTAQREQM